MSLWTELHQSLRNHPKLLHLRTLVGPDLDKDLVRAKLENLWLSALDYCLNGRLADGARTLTPQEIAAFSEWHGDPQQWLDSLIAARWIDVKPVDGGQALYLHDWKRYGGKLLKKRVGDRKRQERHRSRVNDGGSHPPVTRDKRRKTTATATERSVAVSGEAPPPAAPASGDLSALEHPQRAIGLLLLLQLQLDERIATDFAATRSIREIAVVVRCAETKAEPAGWARQALEEGWKRTTPLPEADAHALLAQVQEAAAKRERLFVTHLPKKPLTQRHPGESDESYAARVQQKLREARGIATA